jgi:hypothetical protein
MSYPFKLKISKFLKLNKNKINEFRVLKFKNLILKFGFFKKKNNNIIIFINYYLLVVYLNLKFFKLYKNSGRNLKSLAIFYIISQMLYYKLKLSENLIFFKKIKLIKNIVITKR